MILEKDTEEKKRDIEKASVFLEVQINHHEENAGRHRNVKSTTGEI